MTGKQRYSGGQNETGYLTKLECSGSSGGFAAWYHGTDDEVPHSHSGSVKIYTVDKNKDTRGIYLWQRGGMSGVTVYATYTASDGGTLRHRIYEDEWHYDGETSDGDGTDFIIIPATRNDVSKPATWNNI